MSEPVPSRPHMPGYGLADTEAGFFAWSWAEEHLVASRCYWVSTVRPDGLPHAMPLWGVWAEGRFWFSTGGQSRKAANLAANPAIVVTTENAQNAVVVEGLASKVDLASVPEGVRTAYSEKYAFELNPELGPIFMVAPRRAFGFIDDEDQFPRATRWRFDAS